jgi:DNA-binding transcriptional ArsR family regulator
VLDRIRRDIEDRLKQLLAEADKLRRALEALDPRDKPAPRQTRQTSTPASTRTPRATRSTTPRKPAAARPRAAASTTSRSRTRTPQGATKAKVLAALSSNGGMTAGEVAKATGLGQGSVSTTLSKLAKSGEVTKAERGYRLPAAAQSASSTGGSTGS